MQGTAGEVRTNSWATFSYGHLSYGRVSVGRPTRTYLQQLCADAGCRLEDLLEVMDDRDEWWERFREIHACRISWWWWTHCTLVGGSRMRWLYLWRWVRPPPQQVSWKSHQTIWWWGALPLGNVLFYSYLPTPPLEQVMIKGQFLSGV